MVIFTGAVKVSFITFICTQQRVVEVNRKHLVTSEVHDCIKVAEA